MIDRINGGGWNSTIENSGTPIVELPASTPRNEARIAMAVVAELRDRGVPTRDILVTIREVEQYENSLVRAAIQRGITPTVWTQLPLADTEPYALCTESCVLLDADEVAVESVLRPVEAGWVPASPSDEWPIEPAALRQVTHLAPDSPLPIEEWREWFAAETVADERFTTYLNWVTSQPASPSATEGYQILSSLLERYNQTVLSQVKAQDNPALLETEQTARAVVRMKEVVERIEGKYAEWLAKNRTEQSWEAIGEMCESFATQRPGRREHANATALDIIEANDAWGRKAPYVIALGLTDGVWPRETDSVVPVELQQCILAGDDKCPLLAPRAAWAELRDYDQFADVVASATRGLIVTRHTRTHDVIDKARSPVLASVDVERVPQSAAAGLLCTDRRVPDELDHLLPSQESAASLEETQ